MVKSVEWQLETAPTPRPARSPSSPSPARARHERIISLSNVYEQAYHDARGEEVEQSRTYAKRRDLFRALELATGRELTVLSSPPRAFKRRSYRWLPPLQTSFFKHKQLFCANWDGPKLRYPLSWFFYARHVLRHTRSGDVVMIDNYEITYVLAAWLVRIFRRVTFLLDYEDGKHLIDRGYWRLLSGLAESLGRPLLKGAILAHPSLGLRLSAAIPKEVVPGFVVPSKRNALGPGSDGVVRFLYSGSLDHERGILLILESLDYLPDKGWRFDLTGGGPLKSEVARTCQEKTWRDKVTFHGSLPPAEYDDLAVSCHVGINCQRSADPISGVTFPSKVFSYFSAGLLVLSSKASAVPEICGDACLYFDEETPQALAAAMKRVITNYGAARRSANTRAALDKFSTEGTAARLRNFMMAVGVSCPDA